jgi:tRNA threonylcarbamoyl adenosine modification protein YeaZ
LTSDSVSPSPYALAIHTASPDFGLAIDNFQGDRRQQTWELGRDLSTHLHVYLQEFLQPQTWQDLSFLAVAKGPGGFTGTRLGVVTARTIAQQLNLPLFAISTLAAVAWTKRSTSSSEPPDLAVQMPAQRGELHTAIYGITESSLPLSSGSSLPASPQLELLPLLPDTVMSPDRWQQILASWHRPYQVIPVEGNLGGTAAALLELAGLDWQQGIRPHWSEAVPFYGQSPV